MTTQTSKKQFTIYVVAAFALGWILQIVASIYANKGDNTVFRIIMTVCMFMPLLSVLNGIHTAFERKDPISFLFVMDARNTQYHWRNDVLCDLS